MIQKLMSLLGYKEYLVEITWDSSGEKEIIPMKAWGPSKAIIKVSNLIDVANKAEMVVLNSRKYQKIRTRIKKVECSGVAVRKDNNGRKHRSYKEP